MGVNVSVVAIDAGNSKTDVALIGEDGTVLATARGGGFQPPVIGVEAAIDVLAGVLERAVAELPAPPVLSGHVSACLANADLPVEEAELAAALGARGWGSSVEVRNDTFAILRAGVDEPRGVAVVCGAGINCVGMTPDGRTARFPAIGRISGDWGGGSGLAEEALWFAARAEDGRGEASELARALPRHFGLDSMYGLIEALHRGAIPLGRRHELTPVLFATAEAGDPVAAALVKRQAHEVVAMASVALDRLDLLEEEIPVLLGGSVLAAQHPQLNDRIAALLAARAPKAEVRVVSEPPVLGAALLGLDRTGAGPEVHRRLRARYA
ncbi:ATPase [Streptomyces sp. MBT67]|uniref:N-acetylglucosamine kinase n=1 Tax=unclassified Streptomyces TaxID=2593676 RepID=UPI00190BA530|nr:MULTISPECIES: BadF/BadG/BcrA/BcrD ATPase family protein [unclassified Streptomyces]MBK3532268.1 ATPase [Streptomyces sp. MBT72]MBK3535168.1 ATPase [Streptomyces sp. MBT67]MBK3550547.1 ATPase [Streptomyces sp. MBT61]MBK6030702.1 ATPase [Streptomyces sp. MBT59]